MGLDPERVLRVADWDRLYENNRTRELKRMDWVPIPNRMDGDGYTELVDHQAGAAHLGIWLATVQIASRCEPRGTLLRDRAKPHTPQSLARISRLPAELFEEALPRFIHIGWLEYADANSQHTTNLQGDATESQADAGIPQGGAESLRGSDYGMEGKEGKERNGGTVIPFSRKPSNPTPQALLDAFERFIASYPNQIGLDEACRQWISLVDIGEITETMLPEVLAGLERWNASEQWATEGGKYIPAPAKWLRDRRWKDSPKPVETYQPPPASSAGVNPYAEWIPNWKRKEKAEAA